jgi:hypothetical protein
MRTHRSFPEDISDELLDHYCKRYGEEIISRMIHQQTSKNIEVSWLSLEELNSFD